MNDVPSIGSKRFQELRDKYLLGNVPMAYFKGDVKLSGDFIPNDTIRMEKYIQRRLPKPLVGAELPPAHIVIGLGLYLGEIIISQFNGKWYTYTKNIIWDTVVQLNTKGNNEMELKPIARILNYCRDRNLGITAWYNLVRDGHEDKLPKSENPAGTSFFAALNDGYVETPGDQHPWIANTWTREVKND